jgi:hypothetical protein
MDAVPSAGPLIHVAAATYAVYRQPLIDGEGEPLGVAVVLEDVSGEEGLRHQAAAFNLAVGTISWILVGGLFAYYARSFRGPRISCEQAYAGDEGQTVEFKSSFRWDYKLGKTNKDIEGAVIKTVAAFLNTDGGVLLIGVDDNKAVLGLAPDYQSLKTKPNRDGWTLALQQALTQAIGADLFARNVKIGFCALEGKDICILTVRRARRAVFVEETAGGRRETLYVRLGNATRSLDVKEALAYAAEHWGT